MTPGQTAAVLAGVALVGLVALWRAGASAGRRQQARAGYGSGRVSGGSGRALVIAGLVTGVQWAVTASGAPAWAVALVLGLPALLLGAAVARFSSVPRTSIPQMQRYQGGDWR
ncbi:hypothetical protein [Pseudonocardia asaccharolytica]|uniref:Uncharacterized protein n=1 Tax=Pseudonocardia asaccharolytica DSM 44247 = NBRC 16224 TaxID=1123024 RepID=A0A511D804_9PSEU|nr:hypothetical protein [Pseudonocardia asaccharolytica]GEL20747.1 hypothetical protein PA7_45840 [Pseudonocardia asaccharolytica DSM 44247 = NBRC 16224]